MNLVIRRARPGDKRDVLAAVRTIWGGHDRVPKVFDRWVTNRGGPFFVALFGQRLVGMGKLTVASRMEGWLEGGRVAPRWRRRGIATALFAHRIAEARRRGLGVLRFSTDSGNTPIHRVAKRLGFRRVGVFRRHLAKAARGRPPRRANPGEVASLQAMLGPFIQFGRGWEWRALQRSDVARAVALGRAFVAGGLGTGAAAIVRRGDDGTLAVAAFGGRGRAARELGVGLRAEAARRGLDEVSLYARSPAELRAARAAGFRQPWPGAAYLYELRVRRRAGSAP